MRFSGCGLEDGAATTLGTCLMVNTGLETLDLFHNRFTEAGVHALLEGLESNPCVTGT